MSEFSETIINEGNVKMHYEKEFDDFSAEVRKIEQDAEKIINEANIKKENIISEARAEVSEMVNKKTKALEDKKEDKINKEKIKIDKKKDEIVKAARKEVKSFETSSRKNLDQTADKIIEILEKNMEAL